MMISIPRTVVRVCCCSGAWISTGAVPHRLHNGQPKKARGSGPYRGNLEIKIPLDMLGASVFAYESFCNHLEQFLDWCCILDFGRFGPPVELPKLVSHPVWTCAGGWVLL